MDSDSIELGLRGVLPDGRSPEKSTKCIQGEPGLAPPDSITGERHEFSLPPVDRGKDAWLFLAACFTVEALVWGMMHLTR